MDQFTTFFADNIRFSTADFYLLGLNILGCAFVYYFMRLLRVPEHSWYLTLYSSGVTSFFGVYFFYHVIQDGFMATITNEQDITRYIAIFFIGYCITDLMIGKAPHLPSSRSRHRSMYCSLARVGSPHFPLFSSTFTRPPPFSPTLHSEKVEKMIK